MLKYVLLAGAMTIAAPAMAQTTAPAAANPAPGSTTNPVAPATPATTRDAAPATATTSGATAQVAPVGPQTTGAASNQQAAAALAEQPATGSQVAQVVDSEFGTYDKDSDGKLSQVEFSAWMVALKTKSDPATKADSPATKKWNTAAFAQADADKSKSVSKDELTGFLSKG
jgi:hypothetical protein